MTRPWTRTICASLMAAAAMAAAPAGAVEIFIAIEPCRIFDTRTAGDAPAVPNSRLTSPPAVDPYTFVRPVTIQGNANCPDIPASNVRAVVANVIVVQAQSDGFLSAFPQDVGFNNTSLINFPQNIDINHFARDNGAILPLDDDPSDGDLAVAWQRTTLPLADENTHLAHVVIDVLGYLLELEASGGLVVNNNTVAINSTGCDDGEVLTSDGAGGWACESALGGGGAGFDKTDVYVNSQGGSSASVIGEVLTRTASCNDANDIALSGFCHSTGQEILNIISQNANEPSGWSTTGAAASFTCEFQAQENGGNGQARIVCVNVP